MALSPQWLDELRSRVTLSSVIMRTTKLQKAGNEWKACCPFHNEKSPSFTVNDQKAFYHCFGCQAHGDVISWMTDQRGMSFMDAVKELAAEAGMEVPAADPQSAARAQQRAGLHDVMQSAQDYFVRNLQENGGSGARDYLKSRGFDSHTIERFGFGYAPPDRQGMKAALAKYDEPMLIEGGLRIAVDDKEPYDRFRSRLMLPIQDARGRVIAFGGRILEEGTKAPKYLNSPDTPLFDKGRNLYNLHRAGPASRKTNRVIVVEGYMDVIALACAGIEDAVAPMGTALTETQIDLLWRMVDTPILCFDGDAAGQRASMKAIGRALPKLQPGKSLAFVALPDGLDPDDLINSRGVKVLNGLLDSSNTLLDTLWDSERDAAPLSTPEQKADLRARLIEHVESIAEPTIKSLYRKDLLDLFYRYAFPKRKGGFQRGKIFTNDLSPELSGLLKEFTTGSSRDRLAQAVLTGLARRPELIRDYIDELWKLKPMDMGFAAGLDILGDTAEMMDEGQNPDMEILQEIRSWPIKSHLPFLRPDVDEDYARACLNEAVKFLIKKPALENAVYSANSRLDEDFSETVVEALRNAGSELREYTNSLKEFWRTWAT